MSQMLLTVLNMSITASIVILAVCAARLLLRRVPKAITYALWAVVAFRLIAPFSLESVFSLMPMAANPIPSNIGISVSADKPAPVPATADRTPSAITTPAQPEALAPAAVETAPQSKMSPAERTSISPLAIVSGIWLLGVAAMLAYSFLSIHRLNRRLQNAVLLEGNIYAADGLQTPFVLGFFRPRIYLPTNIDESARAFILLHEQTHIRRGDHVTKLLAYCLLCIHWFNPFVWLAFVLFCTDMELSCDECVLRTLGADVKKDYSSTLVALSSDRRIIAGSPLAFGEGNTKSRIKNILRFHAPARVAVTAAAAVTMVFGIGLVLNRPTVAAGDSVVATTLQMQDLVPGMTADAVVAQVGAPDFYLTLDKTQAIYFLADDWYANVFYKDDGSELVLQQVKFSQREYLDDPEIPEGAVLAQVYARVFDDIGYIVNSLQYYVPCEVDGELFMLSTWDSYYPNNDTHVLGVDPFRLSDMDIAHTRLFGDWSSFDTTGIPPLVSLSMPALTIDEYNSESSANGLRFVVKNQSDTAYTYCGYYTLLVQNDDAPDGAPMEPVPLANGEDITHMVSLLNTIAPGETTAISYNWDWQYGSLTNGFYQFKMEMSPVDGGANIPLTFYFNIHEDQISLLRAEYGLD